MIEITSHQGAVLAFLSLTMLGFIYALCLRCGKKTKIVQVDNQIYNQQIFQQNGSRFAVTRSKKVTRPNQKPPRQSPANETGQFAHEVQLNAVEDNQGSYQNVPSLTNCGNLEQIYIDPIPTPPYRVPADEFIDNETGTYSNIFPTKDINHDSDSSYENTKCLHDPDEDEPDYVNMD